MERKAGFYEKYVKRLLDLLLSLMALCILSPVLLILIVLGAIKMKGNPFFTQQRPGRNEKIFKLIKFRTMTCETDENGQLLPDEQRLNKYGKLLRSTSLDELPELINIFKGDMSIVGPRPLLVEYLPYYTDQEKHRHDVRPGLTGLAQVNGRNNLSWEEKFLYDLEYVSQLSFRMDMMVIIKTIGKVVKRSDIQIDTQFSEGNLAKIRSEETKRERGSVV